MGGGAFMYVFIVALLACVLVTPAPAQVHVDIGIHLPAPPQLVVAPEVRAIQYAPAAPASIFLQRQYWSVDNITPALLSAKLLHHGGISRVLVVSHGIDARRARREFSAAGLAVIPAAPEIPSLTIDSAIQLLPSMGAQSYFALYELFGSVAISMHLSGT